MAALAPTPSLLRLDERLLSIPEDEAPCCSGSPRRWSDAQPATHGAAQGAERVRPLRKCASTPTLHSMQAACGGEEGMEVYVVLRSFKVLFLV